MALRTPPSWLQNGSHPAENDRLSMQAIIATSGIIGSSSLAVSQNSPTGMSVQVAAGWGALVGNFTSNMGVYQFYNDAATVLTVSTANPSNARIDRVVVTISDAFYTGSSNTVAFQVIAGTPAASPVAPATPSMSISLATIAVAAGATSILNANITDTRTAITTNLPVGDITDVLAGTGLSGGGTSGSVTLAIDTTVTADLSTVQLFSNKVLRAPEERTTISATAATGTINFDILTQGVLYYTSNSSANWTLNVRGNSGTTLNSSLATGDALTIVFLVTNGSTAYYATTFQIDGTSVTPKWQNGTAPTAGNASSIDAYTYTIVKTASATYTVFASQTKFA